MIRWLLRHEDGPPALRRAVWIVLAGCVPFFALRYGLHRPVAALYAIFGALPLVLFCHVPGPPRQRTRTLLAALPVGWLMVTAGTLLAVRSWAAACGMLVVGFLVAFCAALGPRAAALSIAHQLYYVLPCFPPYAPQTLGSRLAGLTVGILCTALAERFVWPEPAPVPYRAVLADAADAVARHAERTAVALAAGTGLAALRGAADRALDAARLSRVPAAERPTSPSMSDRALNHAHAALRYVRDQLDRLHACPDVPHPVSAELLRQAAAALRPAAAALRDGSAGPPPPDELAAALGTFDTARARTLDRVSAAGLRQDALVRAAAEGTRMVTEATRIALGARPAPPRSGVTPADEPFGYALVSGPGRWWWRLRAHLTPGSVLLQNAVRVAVALAAARLLAGALDLSHGFWVLLATLSLMRTSAADTRSALVPAFLGTAAGAALAAGLLYAVGDRPVYYAVLLPVVVLVGFGVGPVLGPAWMQAAMTLTFVLIFSQLAAPHWELSGVRLVNVVIGGSVGALAGLLAWPRGAHGRLRQAFADALTASAALCRSVTGALCTGGDGPVGLHRARKAVLLAEATYLQYRTERHPGRDPDPVWGDAMAAAYQALRGGEATVGRHRAGHRVPLPAAAADRLAALAARAAEEYLRSAAALRAGRWRETGPPPVCPARESAPLRYVVEHGAEIPPERALLTADAEAWLTGAAETAGRVRTR
ncbi:FUSC family protein [Streptomyces sp. AV19]|uniref:FUSC family protein n=1 Tax=Streptomyces sp. AV19 TaxID=2793068 RepID=UPI0018FE5FA4|nr:FUSC family protein [Streptomyces sp. AV19]MBH1934508.1 FUSC family protein [Streptomyces sp. AV19]MDG4533302.1 FUSC family protein [Streptomyces sp. AV19]